MTLTADEKTPSIEVHWERFEMKEVSHIRRFPDRPKQESLYISFWWDTESNALVIDIIRFVLVYHLFLPVDIILCQLLNQLTWNTNIVPVFLPVKIYLNSSSLICYSLRTTGYRRKLKRWLSLGKGYSQTHSTQSHLKCSHLYVFLLCLPPRPRPNPLIVCFMRFSLFWEKKWETFLIEIYWRDIF